MADQEIPALRNDLTDVANAMTIAFAALVNMLEERGVVEKVKVADLLRRAAKAIPEEFQPHPYPDDRGDLRLILNMADSLDPTTQKKPQRWQPTVIKGDVDDSR